MAHISEGKKVIIPAGIRVWQGMPSDHSGAYHVILSLGYDGKPVEVAIENPDCDRLEIPGLLDSGWELKGPDVVKSFFASAKTHRPTEGVFLNRNNLGSTEDLKKHIEKLNPALGILLNQSGNGNRSLKLKDDLYLLFFSKIKDQVTAEEFRELDRLEAKEFAEIGTWFDRAKQLLESPSDGFIQIVVTQTWNIDVTDLADIFSWWLWGTKDKQFLKINDG